MDRDHPLIDPVSNFHSHGLSGYGRAFAADRREPGKLYFEGTTHLVYQETALAELPRLATRPKFIFLLREPVARVASSFNYTQGNLAQVKSELTIERYFELLVAGDTRQLRRYVLSEPSAYVLERDLLYSDYWRYLQRWLEVLGHERMLVLQFERLTRQPLECVRQVCDFLDVSAAPFEGGFDFSTRNRTVQLLSSRVHRWAQRAARFVPPGPVKRTLSRTYYRLQRREASQASRPSAQVCDAMRHELEPGTRKLAEAFDIDLELWGIAAKPRDLRAPCAARLTLDDATGGTARK
jgi:hypothetical protein